MPILSVQQLVQAEVVKLCSNKGGFALLFMKVQNETKSN